MHSRSPQKRNFKRQEQSGTRTANEHAFKAVRKHGLSPGDGQEAPLRRTACKQLLSKRAMPAIASNSCCAVKTQDPVTQVLRCQWSMPPVLVGWPDLRKTAFCSPWRLCHRPSILVMKNEVLQVKAALTDPPTQLSTRLLPRHPMFDWQHNSIPFTFHEEIGSAPVHMSPEVSPEKEKCACHCAELSAYVWRRPLLQRGEISSRFKKDLCLRSGRRTTVIRRHSL